MSFSQLFLREKNQAIPIGDGSAIMPLKTDSGSVYWFNTHYSPPEKNVTGQKLPDTQCFLAQQAQGKQHLKQQPAAFSTL